jgi:hypothetical protein
MGRTPLEVPAHSFLTQGPNNQFSFDSVNNTAIVGSFVTLQNQSITSWDLVLTTKGKTPIIQTVSDGDTITDIANLGKLQGEIDNSPGTWEVSAAPGPIPGAGLLSYPTLGVLGLISAGWKRLNKRRYKLAIA